MRPLAALLGGAVLAAAAVPATAEFTRWRDVQGQVRLSNVPPPVVANDGRLRAGDHPLGADRQALQLARRLAARDAALADPGATASPAP